MTNIIEKMTPTLTFDWYVNLLVCLDGLLYQLFGMIEPYL